MGYYPPFYAQHFIALVQIAGPTSNDTILDADIWRNKDVWTGAGEGKWGLLKQGHSVRSISHEYLFHGLFLSLGSDSNSKQV